MYDSDRLRQKNTHKNGICRRCVVDYTKYKSKWGLTSIEQYRNAVCPITQEKLEFHSTYVTQCCKTGIEWDSFNEYCKRKLEENNDDHFKIKCPCCRAKNRKFLPEWSHWFASFKEYDYEYDSEDAENDAPTNPHQLLQALRQIDAIEAREEREASEAREAREE